MTISRLFLLSFLMLFVELALIRYTGASFMHLAFFSNYILMASFLGIAAGFLRSSNKSNWFACSPVFLAGLVYLCERYHFEYQINLNSKIDDLSYTVPAFSSHTLPPNLTLPVIFIAVTLVMTSLANGTAATFRKLPALTAYQFEILGSLAGVVCFTLLAFLQAPPFIWGLIISLLFIALQWPQQLKQIPLYLVQLLALTFMLSVVITASDHSQYTWSPYYKIAVKPYTQHRYAIDVNGAPQQFIESVSQRHLYKPFYFLPYSHLPAQAELANVLIIGAGTGGDVAIALAQGAKHVDAVEIDPALMQIGKRLHPDTPYADPRVTTYINDGRAFLEKSKQRYDLIILALTDSMILVSNQSSLRLENYLLTKEGMTAARAHLTENGTFSMYNYYRNAWIVDRIGNTLSQVYGASPCVDTQGASDHWLSVFTINRSANHLRCSTPWQPQHAALPAPASDNRPFFYMSANTITTMYLLCLLFIGLVTIATIRLTGNSLRVIVNQAEYCLLGAGFLLLETKNVVNFALLFGTTWLVNSLVFIGILSTVFLATCLTNTLAAVSRTMLFTLLILSLMISWGVPLHILLPLPALFRLIIASALAFSPVFFANVIFTRQFKQSTHTAHAFAANTIGAMAGAMLEYSSLVIGYQNLLLVAAGIYTLAILIIAIRQPKIMPTTRYSGAETYS